MSAALPKTDVYRTSSQGGLFGFNSKIFAYEPGPVCAPIAPEIWPPPTRGLERTYSQVKIRSRRSHPQCLFEQTSSARAATSEKCQTRKSGGATARSALPAIL